MRFQVTISLIATLCSFVSAAAKSGLEENVEFSLDSIIVKFKAGEFESDSGSSSLQSVSDLNRILPKNRAVQIKPVFRDFRKNQDTAGALLSKKELELNQKERHLQQRLNRVPQNTTIPDLSHIYKITINPQEDESIHDVIATYQLNPYVEYAEPDYYVRLCIEPNDLDYSEQWALEKIDAPEAWDIHTGSHDVIVAVVDTGVDLTHPDLQGNLWINELEFYGLSGVDDDKNGYIDDIHGYDFAFDDSEPEDYSMGHGTHIAGIIGAKGNNNTQISGICWNVSIMSVASNDPDTLGQSSIIAQGVYYAICNGADIISCSWGMNPPSNMLREAFEYAYSQGVVTVAAAGNDNSSSVFYPAGFDSVISVGASTQSDQRAYFSNYGNWVDIMAPGVDILSLFLSGTTYTWQGTSMACPHVSGTCALMLSFNPSLSPDDVRKIVMNSGDYIGKGICSSNKRVNLFNAVSATIPSNGIVRFDREFYSCSGIISVSVSDADLKKNGSCQVTLTTDYNDVETLILTENAQVPGLFKGSIETDTNTPVSEDGILQVCNGDIVTVSYLDLSGTGRYENKPRIFTETAKIDGQSPVISNIVIDASTTQPIIAFETNEPTLATVRYQSTDANTLIFSVHNLPIYTTLHTIILDDVSAQTDYTFIIEATDRVGNITHDDNDGELYGFTTIADLNNIYVPLDFATIQEAIDHCWEGDTVWVADGIYTGEGNRDIDFKGKAITVRSENGPEICIIDCNGAPDDLHRGFYFHNRETPYSVLDGFTITGGYQDSEYASSDGTISRGGGILCNNACPTIRNCVLSSNYAYYGGGLFIYNDSNVSITNCVFDNNQSQRGAGLYNDGSIIEAIDCLFSHNIATSYYGGLSSTGWEHENSEVILRKCVFRENSAYYGAGALGVQEDKVIITDCEFVGNAATGSDWSNGGAISSSRSNATIKNCLFSGNKSNESAGALYQYMGQAEISNCTFSGNSSLDGLAIACYAYGDESTICSVTNCILWDGGNELLKDDDAVLEVNYSNIQGGYPGESIMDEYPLFVDTGLWYDMDTPVDTSDDIWNNGDYHLQSENGYWSTTEQTWLTSLSNSPCIDAGDPNSPVDLEPAPNGGRINMGAYGGTDQASLSAN